MCIHIAYYTHIYSLDLSAMRAKKQQHPSSNEHTYYQDPVF